VLAIGGGKGGVGKSVVSANLALALARLGKRCIVIDADLGGANLHTLLGVTRPGLCLTDFITRKAGQLSDIVVDTPFPNLNLVSGARAQMEVANLSHAQKLKLIRQVFALEADFVLLDLGAGTAFNVLDFFLAAHEQLLIVVPTPTSVENAYYFLKAGFFRKLKRAVRVGQVGRAVARVVEERVNRGIRFPRELVDTIGRIDPEAGALVQREIAEFRPRILINQVRRAEEKHLGEEMSLACREFFGIEATPLGAQRHDDCVLQSIQLRRPFLDAFPGSLAALSLQSVAQRLSG
jgi:flagellar biosynthesis protein FlhG